MNDAGDMLRVSTNVMGNDGRRAIGTFIAAADAEGTPSPVVASVLAGKPFVGRAFVVNDWYLVAYEPIRESGRVIGMVFTGFPEKDTVADLLDRLQTIRIAKTGYLSILIGSGKGRGTLVLSRDRARDGQDAWNDAAADGSLYVQQLVQAALVLAPGETGELRYALPGDDGPVQHVARFKYFKSWDWVIAASVPEDEFLATAHEVARLNNRATTVLVILLLGATLATVLTWGAVSRRLARQVNALVVGLRELEPGGFGLEAGVGLRPVAVAGRDRAAAALEETSASMEEMSSMTRRNAEGARNAARLVGEMDRQAAGSRQAMGEMVTSISAIRDSSQQVSNIIKTIDEIASQTNILALNAAVEAARAGGAGMGFAVVAGEVRNLAQRSAQAARDTATLIEASIATARAGEAKVEQASQATASISDSVERITVLVDEVSQASQQQSQGIAQVTQAIVQMEKVTQTAAASAEESAAASEELNAQATAAMETVRRLEAMMGDGRQERPGGSALRVVARPLPASR